MGCGNSKAAEPEPPARPKTRPTTARTRTAHPRSQHPSRPPTSQKESYASTTDDDSLRRPQSRSHPKSSRGRSSRSGSSRTGTRQGTRAGTTRRSNHPDPILEEGSGLRAHIQPAEDSAIIFDLGALRAFIRSHVVNYYLPAHTAKASRTIAQRILTLAFSGRSAELQSLPATLLAELQPYWSDPANGGGTHLSALCNSAVKIVQDIQSNPASWTLGPWEDPGGGFVVYPSILRDGVEVLRSEVF